MITIRKISLALLIVTVFGLTGAIRHKRAADSCVEDYYGTARGCLNDLGPAKFSALQQRVLSQAIGREVFKLSNFGIRPAVFHLGANPTPPPPVADPKYVSISTGADTNSGNSESAPFQHVPYSALCSSNCASYSALPGDSIYLKGCDVWTYTEFPISPTVSGTSGNQIYIGPDPTKSWFNATNCPSAWNRPVFQGGAGASGTGTNVLGGSAFFIDMNAGNNQHNYWTIDNIEGTELYANGTPTSTGFVNLGTSDYALIEHLYSHAWHHVSPQICANIFTLVAGTPASYNGDPNTQVSYNVSDGSDSDGGGNCGMAIWGIDNTDHNVITNIPDAIVSVGNACNHHDDLIENILPANDVPETHPDGIFCTGYGTLLNNVVVNVTAGESLSMSAQNGQTDYVVGNLVYGGGNSAPFPFQIDNNGSSPTSTVVVLGNTWVIGAGSPQNSCARVDFASSSYTPVGTLTWINNHCIGSTSPLPCVNISGACGSVPVTNFSNNTLMSFAEAATAGMSSSQSYAYSQNSSNCNGIPTADCPVGNGTNLFSSMTGTIAAGVSDTTYAVTYNTANHTAVNSGRITNVRWTSSSAPCSGSPCGDTGAYLFVGTSFAPVVSLSPSSLSFSSQLVGTSSPSQNVTLTNTGNATLNIANIITSGDFGLTTTCGPTLFPTISCNIAVTFSPTATGTRSGSLSVTDNAAGSPQSVPLSGTGAVTAPPAGAVMQGVVSQGMVSE